MSAQDPRPAARRRKLVLRKIAQGAARTPVAPPSSSYTGLRPTMRPPAQEPTQAQVQALTPSKARPALVLPLEPELDGMEEAELEAELEPEPEEVEPEEEVAALEATPLARDLSASRFEARARDHRGPRPSKMSQTNGARPKPEPQPP